jgi:hypothetical protein
MASLQIRPLFHPLGLVVSAAMALSCGVFASAARGQAIAEAAGATSVSAAAASSIKPPQFPSLPGTAGSASGASGAPSQHLIATPGPPPQEVNVRNFQSHAGKDAGKVLLRATPAEAEIWVDGKIVGKTPLLLVLAPGKYKIEMRGARGETGTSSVDLLPRETREVLLKLHQLYPGRVAAQQ